MVDEGKLEDGGPSPEKVCMVAVCYHNTAVDQLIMQQVCGGGGDSPFAVVVGLSAWFVPPPPCHFCLYVRG